MPESLRRMLAARRRRIFLMPSGPRIKVLEGLPGQLTERGEKPLDEAGDLLLVVGDSGEDVVLLLPADWLLRKSIVLPAGVGHDLGGALALEMDRQTPFAADKVYFDFHVGERSAAGKTITVDLILTPKQRLDPLLAMLHSAGVAPVAVTGLGADGALLPANLLPSERRASKPRVFGRLNSVLAVAVLGLLTAAIAVPVVQKQRAIAALEPRVDAAMLAAREGSATRATIERLTHGTSALIERKHAEPTTLQLLDEVTRAIPDHTWIERVEIDGPEVQLHGQSPSAAGMIALFQASELFADPEFRSPVTQINNSAQEKFHISVRWKGAVQ